jgi:hypothetical protein
MCSILGAMRLPLSIGSAVLFVSLSAANARASDCPPGSVFKSQDGYSWCEPTVCENDGQCNPNEVCRPVPLCMQVGTLTADAATLGDAGKRLVVTQRCAPDKTCPQTTVCSDMSRCVSKNAADKMGLLTASSATPASGTDAGAGAAKKSCGCRAVGHRTESTGGLLFAFALSLFAGRRRFTDARARAGRCAPPPPAR